MSYSIYLDDIRQPFSSYYMTGDVRYNLLQWVIVRSYDEFVNYITKNGLPELISFDHDLSDVHYDLLGQTDFISWDEYYFTNDREMTGYDCAKWLCDYCFDNQKKIPDFLVHSANTVGARNIRGYINNFLKYNPELK